MPSQKPRRARRAPSHAERPITIREIAKEAAVSTATVSRVLNQSARVSDAVRARVQAVMDYHHYVSDGLAASLSSRRSGLIGVVIPTVTNSIYASSTQAIQRVVQSMGHTVLVGVSDFSPEHEERLIFQFLERRVAGMILTGEARSPRVYQTLRRNGVPFVITWKTTDDRSLPCVSFDNRGAAFRAVNHLVGLGHRRIALVCGRSAINDRAAARQQGYRDCLEQHGIDFDPALMLERDFEFVEGRSAVKLLLQRADPPTAVFCANDIQAIGALYECHESGVNVPAHMSIIGFDDLPISQYTQPQLTTIRVPADEMGQRAAGALLDAVRGEHNEVHVELPTDLIVRGSTASPSSAKRREAS